MTLLNNFNFTEQYGISLAGNIKKIIKYCLRISKNKKVSNLKFEEFNLGLSQCKIKALESKIKKTFRYSLDTVCTVDIRDEVICEIEDTEKLLQKLEKLSYIIESDWIKEARNLLYEESISKTISYLDSKISLVQKDELEYSDMLFYKVNLLRLDNKFDEALEIYELLLKMESSFKYIFEYACFLQYSSYNYDLSETLYKKLLKMSPLPMQKAEVLYCLASMYYSNNKFDLSEKKYKEALSIYQVLSDENLQCKGRVADVFYKLALLHSENRNFDKSVLAESEFTEALSIYKLLMRNFPKHYLHKIANALNGLALLHFESGKMDLAKREYKELFKRYKVLSKEYPSFYTQKMKKVNQVLVSF